jgi:succinoglycan biosynthesis transport protein ExoP
MELRQYWNLLRKWIWLVVLGMGLSGGTSFIASRQMTPIYQTSTTLLITSGTVQAPNTLNSLNASTLLAQTYAQILGSVPILEETYLRLGFPVRGAKTVAQAASTEPEQPLSGFSASAAPVPNTQLITVRVIGTDPALITRAANTIAQVFIEWQKNTQQSRHIESKAGLVAEMEELQASIQETESTIRDIAAQGGAADQKELSRLQDRLARYRDSYLALLKSHSAISLVEANSGDTTTVVSPAVEPQAPIRPQVMHNTLLAAALGGILAAGIVFLIEYLDDTVKGPGDLQAAGLRTIAAIQQVSLNGKGAPQALFATSQPRSLVLEAYRTLRTNLQFFSPDRPLRSLMVTSALATEGKTTTTANLGVVMAQSGKRVVLVDADLRRPALHKVFGLSNEAGLTDALVESDSELNRHLQGTDVENLQVLTAGPIPPNPQEMLASQRMRDLLLRLQDEADIVIVDTPPALVVADASLLAFLTDGVLMVVNTGQTRRAAIQQAANGLRQVGANLVGGVLNRVHPRGGRDYYYYSHYYTVSDDTK